MSLRDERLAKGLCPNCGAEAAPYRLCDRCRFLNRLSHFLNKAAKNGDLQKTKEGKLSLWAWHPEKPRGEAVATTWLDLKPDDRRWQPRLRNIPIDVEAQLVKLFIEAGTPLRLDEVYAAWGKLRLRAGRTSAALDLAYIVEAGRKRQAKMARRAERHRKQVKAMEARR